MNLIKITFISLFIVSNSFALCTISLIKGTGAPYPFSVKIVKEFLGHTCEDAEYKCEEYLMTKSKPDKYACKYYAHRN